MQTDVAVEKPDTDNGWMVMHPDGSASEGTDTGLHDQSLELENVRPAAPGEIELRSCSRLVFDVAGRGKLGA